MGKNCFMTSATYNCRQCQNTNNAKQIDGWAKQQSALFFKALEFVGHTTQNPRFFKCSTDSLMRNNQRATKWLCSEK
jgi:hypothetical protein